MRDSRVHRIFSPALAAACIAFVLLLVAGPARADETQACIDASDQGQTLRIDKHLREARDQFAQCARRECPEAIRTRCAEWLEQAQKALPSMVFVVVDSAGNDVSPVRVALDGASLTEHYDGAAVVVNPGEHRLRFEWPGHAPLERVVRLAEGEKDRRERVVFPSATPVQSPTTNAEAPPQGSGQGVRTAGFVSGGLGLVGLVVGGTFGVLAISKNDAAHCDAASVCQDPQSRRDAQGFATVSTVAFVAGGALVGSGIVLVLLAPKREPERHARLELSPWMPAGGGGVTLGGSW
ncbi:MAG TPA: hypothetical protein VGI39_44700 [Polyangiaceae bacterium]|jgi:hypothetical protein